MRTISIEVNGDATVLVNGVPIGTTPTSLPSAVSDESADIRHDTPTEVCIAIAAHMALRGFQRSSGEAVDAVWSELAGNERAAVIERIRDVEQGTATTAEEMHDRWAATWKDAGWVYGPQRSFANRTDPGLVPFAQLSAVRRRAERLLFAIATTLLAAD